MTGTLPILTVDAFTSVPYAGNPCAVVLECNDLSDSQMLTIAKEMNLSETAFVMTKGIKLSTTFRVRYFTPASEIPFAGHPTIATARALVQARHIDLSEATHGVLELQFVLPTVPKLPVFLTITDGQVTNIALRSPPPKQLSTTARDDVLSAFHLKREDVHGTDEENFATVSCGTPFLGVPLNSRDSVLRAQHDIPAHRALVDDTTDWLSPFLYSYDKGERQSYARLFCLPPDVTEDPFTGSATCIMASQLYVENRLEPDSNRRHRFTAMQGDNLGRPGRAEVEVYIHDGLPADRTRQYSDIVGVSVGGEACVVMQGQLAVPP